MAPMTNVISITDRLALTFLALIPIGVSCSWVVDHEHYVHVPTRGAIMKVCANNFQEWESFSDHGVLFIPHFAAFTRSDTNPESFLQLYSLDRAARVFFIRATLSTGSGKYSESLLLDKQVTLDRFLEDESLYEGNIPLFSGKNVDLESVWSEDRIVVDVYYRVVTEEQSGESSHMTFHIVRRVGKEIAWPT